MPLLLTQDWDVIRGKEDAYSEFVTKRFIPECNELGLESVGGFYVQIGFGPKIISVKSARSLGDLYQAIASERYRALKEDLRKYVINYSSKVLESSGAVPQEDYAIQKGVWKYNLYFDVRPETRAGYASFLRETYLAQLRGLDYVDVTEVWNVLIGGFSEAIIELTFRHPVDVGRILDNQDFREVTYTLLHDYARNYRSRLLRTTERFDEPRWFRL